MHLESLDQLDADRLLDLVEGTLDRDEATAFEAELARVPGALEMIRRLREDRGVLQRLPDPALPADFRAAVEPMLARPMLMESRPGAYRRQRHRRDRRRKLVFALAASIGLLLTGGGAVLMVLRVADRPEPVEGPSRLVDSTPTPVLPAPGPDPDASLEVAWPPIDAIVHHRTPLPEVSGVLARSNDPVEASGPGATHTLPVLLTVNGTADAAEPSLASGTRRHAVVRNFSYEEARRIEEQWMAKSTGRKTDVVAAVGTPSEPELELLVQRVRQVQRMPREGRGNGSGSGLISGPGEMAPNLQEQLRLSSLGATHAVAMPVSELREWLASLQDDHDLDTSLQWLDADARGSWIEDLARAREAVETLERTDPRGTVIVAVRLGVDD